MATLRFKSLMMISSLSIILRIVECNNTILKVTNGEYSGLTLKLDEHIPRHLCFRTLNNLEELLERTSLEFFKLTNGRALFTDINLILPKSWKNTECLTGRNISTSMSSNVKPNIFVSSPHPIFGSKIVATQFGQCGIMGQKIDLPFSSLTYNKTLDPSLVNELLQEWIKYRFGVFSEVGINGDRLYPLYSLEGEHEFLNDGCNLTHSDNNKVICPWDADYNRDVITKQNILCNGASIWEMIEASGDLWNKNKTTFNQTTKSQQLQFKAPHFNFILPQEKLYILILDRSGSNSIISNMQQQKQEEEEVEHGGDEEKETRRSNHWEILQQALFQFITRLNYGDSLSIITYGPQESSLNLPPTVITELNRAGLHGRIPRRSLRGSSNESCLNCALKMALKVARTSAPLSSTLILASGSSVPNTIEYLEEVKSNHLPVYAISLSPEAFGLEELTTYGEHYVVSPKLVELSSTLNSVLSSVVSDSSVIAFHQESVILSGTDTKVINGNFIVEEKLRKNLWIVVTAEDERDIELFEVLSPTGEKYSFPSYEHNLAYFNLEDLNEPGIWSYTIKLYQTLNNKYPVHINVLGEPNETDAITLNSWVEIVDSTKVFLYAQVKQGQLPVLDADVVATIIPPGTQDPIQVQLRDFGTGYPDITRGDGIYTAYFTNFASISGNYRMSIKATHNKGNARTPKLSSTSIINDIVHCSGGGCSALPVSYTIPTNPFQRLSTSPSFYVPQTANFYVRQGSGRTVNDIYPPSRITDFKLDKYLDSESLFVNLKWTAPGGDYDQGKAFRYEIRCYTSREALRDENFNDMSIPVHATLIPQPDDYGTEQTCTVGVPWANEVFYYAIVAYDEAGNRGLISNTISVYIKEEISTVSSNYVDGNFVESTGSLNYDSNPAFYSEEIGDKYTYIIVGVVSFVLVLVIIGTALGIFKYYKILVLHKSSKTNSSGSSLPITATSSLSGTLKKMISLPDVAPEKDGINNWSNSSDDDETSEYHHSKLPPSISEGVSWNNYTQGLQKATSQELPGIHKVTENCYIKFVENATSPSRITQSTDCSIYESDGGGSDHLPTTSVPPRISVLEDCSVYRDLSNLSIKQNFNINMLPPELQNSGHVITVPPYYDVDTMKKSRHESLV